MSDDLMMRNALIGTKNSLQSAAALLEQHGDHLHARALREDVEIAEAALKGKWSVLTLMRDREQQQVRRAA